MIISVIFSDEGKAVDADIIDMPEGIMPCIENIQNFYNTTLHKEGRKT
jgi:hypothetical protein